MDFAKEYAAMYLKITTIKAIFTEVAPGLTSIFLMLRKFLVHVTGNYLSHDLTVNV